MFPFGYSSHKLFENGTGQLECMHGPEECVVDTMFACIVYWSLNKVDYFMIIIIKYKKLNKVCNCGMKYFN